MKYSFHTLSEENKDIITLCRRTSSSLEDSNLHIPHFDIHITKTINTQHSFLQLPTTIFSFLLFLSNHLYSECYNFLIQPLYSPGHNSTTKLIYKMYRIRNNCIWREPLFNSFHLKLYKLSFIEHFWIFITESSHALNQCN